MRPRCLLPAIALILGAVSASAQQRPLRLVLNQELTILDPVVSTNTATRNFSYAVFDTLIAIDTAGAYRPQMLESWAASDDRLTWTFRLRPGLAWHDGAPVTAEDCIASIRRWGARDALGQLLMTATKELRVIDANSFALELARPFGFVVEALGKPANNVPFMMPARIAAATPPNQQVAEIMGSGPFTFRRDEWRPGDRLVLRRNAAYRPREEAADGLAGGKVVHVDRAEIVSIGDVATKVAALQGNEVDFLEFVPPDFVARLRRDRNVRVTNPPGGLGQLMTYISLNHAQPPFDNPVIRRAAQAAIDQAEVMVGTGLPADMRLDRCISIYTCQSPATSDGGAELLRDGGTARARALLREAGYGNERLVFLHPTDSVTLNPVALVASEQLRRAGFNVDVWSSDWASVAQRRLNREPVERGGWSAVTLGWTGIDLLNPIAHSGVAFNCREYPGWYCDPALTPLLVAYGEAAEPARRAELAARIQERFHANVNFVIAGQLTAPQAYRAALQGVVEFPYPLLWNIRRDGR